MGAFHLAASGIGGAVTGYNTPLVGKSVIGDRLITTSLLTPPPLVKLIVAVPHETELIDTLDA